MSEANGNPRISLCMIVRDEEEKLARCLRSAAPWVDEMIIVDTGSVDRTREIAAEFGAQVLEFPWTEDFSAARNFAIEAASGEWILSLDADETLSSSAGRELRNAVENGSYVGAYIPLRDIGDEGKQVVALMFRAFRNREDIRWRYRIHEQVLPDAIDVARAEGLSFAKTIGEIVHDGYTTEVMTSRNKDERNIRLFELQVEDTPDDIYTLYKFADYLRRFDDRDEQIIELFERGYALAREMDEQARRELTYVGDMCGLLGLSYIHEERFEDALDVTTYGLEHCRESANLWYVHGNALLMNGRAPEAEEAFEKTKTFEDEPQFVPPAAGITTIKSDIGLVRAIAGQGDPDRAANVAWELLGNYPDDQDLPWLWTEAEASARNVSRYTQRLIERVQIHPLCGVTWMRGGELFLKLRLFKKALPWLMRATETMEDPGQAFADQGECLICMGHYTEAVQAFSEGLPSARCRAGILVLSIAYGLEIEMEIESGDEELKKELRSLVQNLRDLGERKISQKISESLGELEDAHPTAHEFMETALA